MWTLERPSYTARATFTICISRVRDAALKARLEGVTQDVVDASTAFDAAAKIHALHRIPRVPTVGGVDITTDEMEKVYTLRMARIG